MHKEFFAEIRRDHKEVKDMLKQLTDSSGGASKVRDELFAKLKKELVPHLKSEEKVFYPVLKKNDEAREDVLESMEEHHVTDLVLAELEKMPKKNDEWMAKLKVFKELVEHHIKEEESKVFEDARKAIDEKAMQSILAEFQKSKEQIRSAL